MVSLDYTYGGYIELKKAQSNNKTTEYLHSINHQGSLISLTDTNGNIVKEITYNSYGKILKDTNPSLNIHKTFANGLYDKDTNLIRFGKRDYDPMTGTWTAKDPMGYDGGDFNLYRYVLGDPVNLVDPLGLKSNNDKFIPPKMSLPYCFIVAGIETKVDFCEDFINKALYDFKYYQYCKTGDRQACKFACEANDFYENLKKYCPLKIKKQRLKKCQK